MSFFERDIAELSINPFTMIAKEWMLLAAGNAERGYNAMTVSWGHLGAIWGQEGGYPTAVIYVRPQRYTKEFVDREELFTLSPFGTERRKELSYLGSHSGREGDKIGAAGLTPFFTDGTVCFREAKRVFLCRKLYHMRLREEGFLDPSVIRENYPAKDYHEMYVGKIFKVLERE